jgi:glycosyltransferase involved in cell wall biosynthesis
MESQMPKASVIIITHNRPRLLQRAVESARIAGTDLEIVVVDNASVDETPELCKSLPGIEYVRIERKQELGGARNVGLAASRGEYVTFLDDDDVRLPNTVDQQIGILETEPSTGLIYGQAIFANQDSNPQHRSYPRECPQGDIFWKLLTRNFIPCGSVIFRRSCLSRVGLFDDDIPRITDWDLWVRIAELYPIIAVETPVFVWRRSTPASGQATSQAAKVVLVAVRQFRRRWMNLQRAANASRESRQAAWRGFCENMAEHLIWESARAVRYGHFYQASKNVLTVRRLHPLAIAWIVKNRISRPQWTRIRDYWSEAISHADAGENRVSRKM